MQRRSQENIIPESVSAKEAVSIASLLWSTVEGIHSDINAMARSNPSICISTLQINVMNGLFQQIIRLLEGSDYAKNLRLLKKDDCYTFADALIIVGQYKGALRAFRVNVLGEGQYTF